VEAWHEVNAVICCFKNPENNGNDINIFVMFDLKDTQLSFSQSCFFVHHIYLGSTQLISYRGQP